MAQRAFVHAVAVTIGLIQNATQQRIGADLYEEHAQIDSRAVHQRLCSARGQNRLYGQLQVERVRNVAHDAKGNGDEVGLSIVDERNVGVKVQRIGDVGDVFQANVECAL